MLSDNRGPKIEQNAATICLTTDNLFSKIEQFGLVGVDSARLPKSSAGYPLNIFVESLRRGLLG